MKTEQELFWEGEFGDAYISRNQSKELLWILEHPTTYTSGIRFNKKDILDKIDPVLLVKICVAY